MLAITSVMKDRAWILPYWLQAVYQLDWPKPDIALMFMDDASSDSTLEILKAFVEEHEKEYQSLLILRNTRAFDESTNSRDTKNRYALYRHLASLRNILIERCISCRAGLQFSLDSDILPIPGLIKALAKHNLPYVSSIVLNDNSAHFNGGLDYTFPRARFCNFAPVISPARVNLLGVVASADGLVFAHRTDYPMNSLLQVGMSGACYLIDKQVIYSGARYGFHPFGEDGWYCLELANRGVSIYVDTTIRSIHIMEQTQLSCGVQLFEELRQKKDWIYQTSDESEIKEV